MSGIFCDWNNEVESDRSESKVTVASTNMQAAISDLVRKEKSRRKKYKRLKKENKVLQQERDELAKENERLHREKEEAAKESERLQKEKEANEVSKKSFWSAAKDAFLKALPDMLRHFVGKVLPLLVGGGLIWRKKKKEAFASG